MPANRHFYNYAIELSHIRILRCCRPFFTYVLLFLTMFTPNLAVGLTIDQSVDGRHLDARAVLVAKDSATLSAELVARITHLPVKMGVAFDKGDLLVQLDCRVYEAERQKVLSERNLAELKLKNNLLKHRLEAIGEMELAMSEAEFSQLEAQLNIVTLNTERCQIRAPFAGYVVQTHLRTFEIAGHNQELIEITSSSLPDVEFIVAARWHDSVRQGMVVEVSIEELQQVLYATVTLISPVVDPLSRTLLVKASLIADSLENAGLVSGQVKAGMSALVTLPTRGG